MNIRQFARAMVCAGLLFLSRTAWTENPKSEEMAIRSIYESYGAAIAAKNIDMVMSFYTPDVVAFDAFPPRQYSGAAAYRKDYEDFFAAFPGPSKSKIEDMHFYVAGNLASAYGIDHWVVTGSDGQPLEFSFRFTDVLKKINGKWLIFHEHLSFPVDAMTGKADFLSKP